MRAVESLNISALIGSIFPKYIKMQMKKYQRVSLMTLKSDANFEKKLTLRPKNDMRNLVNFNASSGKFESFHLDRLLLQKVCNVSSKKIQRGYVVKNDLWFQKRHKSFGEFSHQQLNVMLDKSSAYNVLAEGMYFFGQEQSISTFRTFYCSSEIFQNPHVIF